MSHRLIGYITLAALVVFIWMVVVTGVLGDDKNVVWTAHASDIGNLKVENQVKINGMEVGQVLSIRRENGQALVQLTLLRDLSIRRDYKIYNQDASITGDRSLTLYTGVSKELFPVDSPLFITFRPGIAEGIANADSLGALVRDLRAMVAKYSAVDAKNDTLFTTQLHKMLHLLDNGSAKMEALITSNEQKVNILVKKTVELSGEVRRQAVTVSPKAERAVVVADSLSRQANRMMVRLSPAIAKLDTLLQILEKPDNTMMKAMADKKSYESLKASIKKFRSLMQILGDEGIGLDVDFF